MTKHSSLYKRWAAKQLTTESPIPNCLSNAYHLSISRMFTRFASLLPIATLAAVVAGTGTTSECTTGALHCCNSVTTVRFPCPRALALSTKNGLYPRRKTQRPMLSSNFLGPTLDLSAVSLGSLALGMLKVARRALRSQLAAMATSLLVDFVCFYPIADWLFPHTQWWTCHHRLLPYWVNS